MSLQRRVNFPRALNMKPSQELVDLWLTVADLMPFHSDGVKALLPCEVDEIPVADERGRINLDGWKITWEGKVQPGKWPEWVRMGVHKILAAVFGRDGHQKGLTERGSIGTA